MTRPTRVALVSGFGDEKGPKETLPDCWLDVRSVIRGRYDKVVAWFGLGFVLWNIGGRESLSLGGAGYSLSAGHGVAGIDAEICNGLVSSFSRIEHDKREVGWYVGSYFKFAPKGLLDYRQFR